MATAIGNIEIIPSGHALGAEVRGLDLSKPLDTAALARINAAWDAHLVLTFRGQQMGDPRVYGNVFSRISKG